jgi:hypothetical protein
MTAMTNPTSADLSRGGIRTFIRRLYFYGMALVSFLVALAAVNTLLRVLTAVWLEPVFPGLTIDTLTRNAVAGSGGLLLVATPIFLVHWAVVQRWREPAERGAGMRKFFLYAAALVSIGYALVYGYTLLLGITRLALGMSAEASEILPSAWLHLGLMVGIGSALSAYFLGVLAQDGDLGEEIGSAGTWRRIFQTLAGLVGLWLVIVGSVGLLETLLNGALGLVMPEVRSTWVRPILAEHLTQLLVGALLWRLNWVRWEGLTRRAPHEAQSALRRFYLYATVVSGALTVLLPAAALLQSLLEVAFGSLALRDLAVGDALTTALAAAPVGLVIWRWHWRYLQREAATYGESPEGALIRRLYYYAVAATGLILLWLGAVDVLQVALDFGRSAGEVWARPLATGLSLVTLGAPIWAFHWQVQQREARRPDDAGRAERASGPRKVYLYGLSLASALVVLFFLAQVVYRLLLLLLGDTSGALLGINPVADLARTVLAAIIWGAHGLVLRTDGRLGADPLPDVPPALELDEQRAILQARITQLEIDLTALRAELAALE